MKFSTASQFTGGSKLLSFLTTFSHHGRQRLGTANFKVAHSWLWLQTPARQKNFHPNVLKRFLGFKTALPLFFTQPLNAGLRRCSVYPLPSLVIADLKMPGISGFDLIQWMRADAYAKRVPILILSSSSLSNDVNTAYALGANAYMVKPADPRALERLLRTIAEFWSAGEAPIGNRMIR